MNGILAQLAGKNVIVRTVTHYHTGCLGAADDKYIRLDDAAWIADTGRWGECLKLGKLDEVEPFPGSVYISQGAIVDIAEWQHALPRDVIPLR